MERIEGEKPLNFFLITNKSKEKGRKEKKRKEKKRKKKFFCWLLQNNCVGNV